MAVTLLDSASPVDSTTGDQQTIYTSYDFTGANLVVIFCSSSGGDNVTSITVNGVSATLSHRTANTGGGYSGRAAWVLANPTSGNVVMTPSSLKERTFGMFVFSGADTTTPLGTWVETGDEDDGSVTTGTITGGDSNGLFIAHMTVYPSGSTCTWSANHTGQELSGYLALATKAGAASTTVGATSNGTHINIAGVYVNAGSSEISITAGAGALTAAGQTPSLTVQYYRNPGAGALTAAGHAPTFIERGTRYAYPTADISAGTWLASTGSDLYAMIDEDPASDTDYIYTNAAGACEIRLLPVTDPVSSSGYAVNYRIWSPVGGNAVVRLKQGATTIATWTHTGLPTSPTDYSQALAGAEADAITDHDDLRLEIEAT